MAAPQPSELQPSSPAPTRIQSIINASNSSLNLAGPAPLESLTSQPTSSLLTTAQAIIHALNSHEHILSFHVSALKYIRGVLRPLDGEAGVLSWLTDVGGTASTIKELEDMEREVRAQVEELKGFEDTYGVLRDNVREIVIELSKRLRQEDEEVVEKREIREVFKTWREIQLKKEEEVRNREQRYDANSVVEDQIPAAPNIGELLEAFRQALVSGFWCRLQFGA